MKGVRVKLTFTFSAVGTCAPLFILVSGLSEREMPTEDCIALLIKSLSIGGGGLNVGNTDIVFSVNAKW